MIIGKLWASFKAQLNKLANFFWTVDPIAQMQYEYDQAVEQLKTGREGLAQYPEADTDKDGILTLKEARAFLAKQRAGGKIDGAAGAESSFGLSAIIVSVVSIRLATEAAF